MLPFDISLQDHEYSCYATLGRPSGWWSYVHMSFSNRSAMLLFSHYQSDVRMLSRSQMLHGTNVSALVQVVAPAVYGQMFKCGVLDKGLEWLGICICQLSCSGQILDRPWLLKMRRVPNGLLNRACHRTRSRKHIIASGNAKAS